MYWSQSQSRPESINLAGAGADKEMTEVYIYCNIKFIFTITFLNVKLTFQPFFICSGIKKTIDMKILWNIRGIGAGAE